MFAVLIGAWKNAKDEGVVLTLNEIGQLLKDLFVNGTKSRVNEACVRNGLEERDEHHWNIPPLFEDNIHIGGVLNVNLFKKDDVSNMKNLGRF